MGKKKIITVKDMVSAAELFGSSEPGDLIYVEDLIYELEVMKKFKLIPRKVYDWTKTPYLDDKGYPLIDERGNRFYNLNRMLVVRWLWWKFDSWSDLIWRLVVILAVIMSLISIYHIITNI